MLYIRFLLVAYFIYSSVNLSSIHIILMTYDYQIRSDQSLSRVRLFATPWIAARQASLSITNSQSSLRLTSIKSVMPSSHLILCRPLLLLPPIPPGIIVFSNESTLCMRWPKYSTTPFRMPPRWLSSKESACQCRRCGSDPWVRKIPWRMK